MENIGTSCPSSYFFRQHPGLLMNSDSREITSSVFSSFLFWKKILLNILQGLYIDLESLFQHNLLDAGPEKRRRDEVCARILAIERSDNSCSGVAQIVREMYESLWEDNDIFRLKHGVVDLSSHGHEPGVERALLDIEELRCARMRVGVDNSASWDIEPRYCASQRVKPWKSWRECLDGLVQGNHEILDRHFGHGLAIESH
jgi:hypothetical protein